MQENIIDAKPEDVPEIRKVLRITWLATYPNEEHGITIKDIEERFDDSKPDVEARLNKWKERINTLPDSHEWVAKTGGKVIAWCLAVKRNENHIQTLYVLPEYQGKGIGGELLIKALDWLGQDQDVSLNVASYNTNAIKFYEKFGFIDMGPAIQNDVQPFASGKYIPENRMVRSVKKI